VTARHNSVQILISHGEIMMGPIIMLNLNNIPKLVCPHIPFTIRIPFFPSQFASSIFSFLVTNHIEIREKQIPRIGNDSWVSPMKERNSIEIEPFPWSTSVFFFHCPNSCICLNPSFGILFSFAVYLLMLLIYPLSSLLLACFAWLTSAHVILMFVPIAFFT